MAEAPAQTATRPRKRAAAPAKKTTAAKAPAAEDKTGAVTDGDTTRVTFEMVDAGPTKSYAKYQPPADSGVVGTLYFPLGTTGAKVLFYGPAE